MHYVLGSGLSGVACAQALLDAGASVSMIDVGEQCEPQKRQAIESLSTQEPQSWDPDIVNALKGDFLAARRGLAFKPAYGSDFPYAKEALKTISQDGTKCLISYAQGGLSNVWGAAVLPYRREDFRGWPIDLDALEASYKAVAKVIKIAARHDDLEAMFPFYGPHFAPTTLSSQARALLDNLEGRRQALQSEGIVFGQSRLAVRTAPDENGPACKNVGLCLTGCPYSAIYCATYTLKSILKNPRFRYLPGLIVEKVEETTKKEVKIVCRSLTEGRRELFFGKRVFVACGALATTKIIVNSLSPQGAMLTMRCQPYFLLPLLMIKGGFHASAERLHALAQIFIEILDCRISEYPVHLQLYTYNEFYQQRLRQLLRKVPILGNKIEEPLLDRIAAIQGYLHSDEAEGVSVRAVPGAAESMRLELSGRVSFRTRRKISLVLLKILRQTRSLGVVPLLPLAEVGRPGEGNHIGAIFPMAAKPAGFESDSLGRVGPLRRVHVVDSSVLTTLPSTTLSYTIMANAHRIATKVLEQDLQSRSMNA